MTTKQLLSSVLIVAASAQLLAQGHKDRPPSVSIAASGSPYTSARTVPITANASDDRGIRQVEFFDGGASKGIDTSAPYSVDWSITTAQNGVHNWWATATDTAGHRTDSATIYLTVTIATTTPPSTTDPTWTFCAAEGARCTFTGTHTVRYGANGVYATQTLSDGTLCSNAVFGDPIVGVVKHCEVGAAVPTPTPTPTPIPTPTTTGVGPQASITCPTQSVIIVAGGNIQAAVDANPGGTAFCLGAGTTFLRASIRPKSGDTFVGTYGAILDGTGWLTNDTTAGAFRAWNEDIDDVTIRNLVIRNVPMGGVTAFRDFADRWLVENVEVGPCGGTGINLPHSSIARRPYVHDCAVGGYAAYLSNNTRWEDGEFARNGNESKISLTAGTVMLRNFVHHSINCLWLDGENIDWLLDSNRCEDNTGNGLYIEVSGRGIARNNQVRRSGENGALVSLSHDVQLVGNLLEGNAGGIVYFVDCSRVGSPEGNYQYPGHVSVPFAMGNIASSDNTITVGTQPGAFANGFNYASCTQAELDAYLNGSMGLTFTHNRYVVPAISGSYWLWNGMKSWAQWQAIPHDATGSVQ